MTNNIRHANENDIRNWYGRIPATMRAIVMEVDGDTKMICGVMHQSDHYMAFMDMKDDAKQYPVAIMKASRLAVKEIFSKYHQPILAIVSSKYESAPRYLRRLGFVLLNEKVMIWQTHSQ
ncbi:hypothetical protein RF656_19775 [Yersinia kristensenii]|uniref:hypothetical protein n=1 Tax=Yersinia kristensenii TaxID=28152 RepID=UPI0028536AB9|nr:hypothetical protein [Yersinia kristensenii]MDR4898959.1 hypothetical protein [Yersinia kristensenii]